MAGESKLTGTDSLGAVTKERTSHMHPAKDWPHPRTTSTNRLVLKWFAQVTQESNFRGTKPIYEWSRLVEGLLLSKPVLHQWIVFFEAFLRSKNPFIAIILLD